jgi:hypothetical protein
VPDLSFRRFRPVLDLGEQLRLDPDAFVSDPLRVGLERQRWIQIAQAWLTIARSPDGAKGPR